MIFDKYERQGDYHWQAWRTTPSAQYCHHARFCVQWVKERPVLDVGCGDGLITRLFGLGAFGVDDSEKGVKFAISHHVPAMHQSIYDLHGFSGWPAVFMGDVIEHLQYPVRALKKVHEVLDADGFLYLSTPPKQKTLSDYHYREYTPAELTALVEQQGFVLQGSIIVKPEWVEMYGKFKKK